MTPAEFQKLKKNPEQYAKHLERARKWKKATGYKWDKKYNGRYAETRRRWDRTEGGKLVRRRALLKKKFGISLADYDAMFAKQGGVCKICGGTQAGRLKKHFAVDHCHSTGKVRGLLCDPCNQSLGLMRENRRNLLAAVDYLNGVL